MAAVPVFGVGELPARLRHEAAEARHADITGRVPDAHPEVGHSEPVEQPPTVGVGDGERVDRTPAGRLREPPQGGGVAFDHLAQTVADGLDRVVAGGEAVGACLEAAASGRQREREVGADRLEGNPRRCAVHEVAPLDPQQREARSDVIARARQQVRICDPMLTAHLRAARELQRLRDVLGVPEFGGLHDARRLRRREGHTFALRDGDRASIGSNDHHHRDADAVEPGHVGDAGDAHRCEQGPHPDEGVLRRTDAMCAERVVVLATGPGEHQVAVGRHREPASNARASRRSGVSTPTVKYA